MMMLIDLIEIYIWSTDLDMSTAVTTPDCPALRKLCALGSSHAAGRRAAKSAAAQRPWNLVPGSRHRGATQIAAGGTDRKAECHG